MSPSGDTAGDEPGDRLGDRPGGKVAETSAPTRPAPPRRWTQAAFATSIFTLWREWCAGRARRAAAIAANPETARSVAAIVRAAGLPGMLGNLVERTARRTRLRRGEKLEIARELARHLRDGLDSGASADVLAATFGDPAQTARMLREATIAKRSLLDRGATSLVRWGSLTAAVLLAVYLAMAARLWFRAPKIAFDPFERMNATLPQVPTDEAAWPRYREALRWARAGRATNAPGAETGTEPWMELLSSPPNAIKPRGALTRDEAIAQLDAHDADLAGIRAAAALPALGVPIGGALGPEDREFFEGDARTSSTAPNQAAASTDAALLPHFWALRDAARWLAADAHRSTERGRPDRAVDDLVAMLGIARQAREGRSLVAQLVASAIWNMAAAHARDLLEAHGGAFDDATLRRLDDAFAAIPDAAWRPDFSIERILFEDAIQRTYSDDGHGDGVLLVDPARQMRNPVPVDGVRPPARAAGTFGENLGGFLASPLSALLVAGRREIVERYGAMVDDIERRAARPLWEIDALVDPKFAPAGDGGAAFDRYAMVDLLSPALTSLGPALALTKASVDATRAAIALARFELAEGRWPRTLDELVPRFLASIPRDPYDGGTIRYALRDGRPLLWYVGGDRHDDGGRPASGDHVPDQIAASRAMRWVAPSAMRDPPAPGQPASAPVDGDWIVFAGPEAPASR
ncbi:MAG: hypothetical protein U0575_07770 [Phycisphaerales bacterium]